MATRKAKRKAPAKKRPAAKKRATAKRGTASKRGSTAKKKAAPKKKKAAAKPQAMKPVKKARKVSRPRNANLSYTQAEFLDNICGFCGLEKRKEAKELVEDLSCLIKDALKKGYKLPLMGLGKMYVRKTKARMGRNPMTGEPIHIRAKKRVRFTPAKALKEAVL